MSWLSVEISDCTGWATYTAQCELGERILRAWDAVKHGIMQGSSPGLRARYKRAEVDLLEACKFSLVVYTPSNNKG
ncbi:hypothetical protein BKA61DRAFT_682350 [Leptodontidium sp. MPI-SDFR-AT-0119]|nr:hypothetical protein BKA61DRAFT_682350 [Leptodontidium sp. MPI-SDFR-AT-0119]